LKQPVQQVSGGAPVVTPLDKPQPPQPAPDGKPMLLVQPPLHEEGPKPPRISVLSEPGEPPLAPLPGPVQMYQVRHAAETLHDIARRTLGDAARWGEVHKLNPELRPDAALGARTLLRPPAPACPPAHHIDTLTPL